MPATNIPEPHPEVKQAPRGIEADEVYDAGSLGCGDGPLSRIAAALKRMPPGSVLEVRSSNPGVSADLPAWCRMVGHDFLGERPDTGPGRYIIQRKDD